MPYVYVDWRKQNAKTKRACAKAVTAAFVRTLKIPPEYVRIIFCDHSDADFAHGGILLQDELAKKPKPARAKRRAVPSRSRSR